MTQLVIIISVLFGPLFGLMLCTGDLVRKLLGVHGPDWSHAIPYFALRSIPLFALASMPSVPACYAAVSSETTLDLPIVTIISMVLVAILGGAIHHVFKKISEHDTALAVHAKELQRLERIEDKLDKIAALVRNGHK